VGDEARLATTWAPSGPGCISVGGRVDRRQGSGPVRSTEGHQPRPQHLIGYGPSMSWQRGEHIWWHYRRPAWQPGDAEFVDPMTVVRDDERGLVAWLAPGTERLKAILPNGKPLRAAEPGERFVGRQATARGQWEGPGILRIAPLEVPWSIWLFWDEQWVFDGWYVNLEAVHHRDGPHLLSSDRVLDVWISHDGVAALKDEDELEGAVAEGAFTAEEAKAFRRDARTALDAFEAGGFPFDEQWQDWRPDPGWERPVLPAEATWDHDELER
jgi:Protein of unknown function (DUF402)